MAEKVSSLDGMTQEILLREALRDDVAARAALDVCFVMLADLMREKGLSDPKGDLEVRWINRLIGVISAMGHGPEVPDSSQVVGVATAVLEALALDRPADYMIGAAADAIDWEAARPLPDGSTLSRAWRCSRCRVRRDMNTLARFRDFRDDMGLIVQVEEMAGDFGEVLLWRANGGMLSRDQAREVVDMVASGGRLSRAEIGDDSPLPLWSRVMGSPSTSGE